MNRSLCVSQRGSGGDGNADFAEQEVPSPEPMVSLWDRRLRFKTIRGWAGCGGGKGGEIPQKTRKIGSDDL